MSRCRTDLSIDRSFAVSFNGRFVDVVGGEERCLPITEAELRNQRWFLSRAAEPVARNRRAYLSLSASKDETPRGRERGRIVVRAAL